MPRTLRQFDIEQLRLPRRRAGRPYAMRAVRTMRTIPAWQGFARPHSAAESETLRGHVVNLEGGLLSTSGAYRTTEQDLDALVAQLDRWASFAGHAPRVVLYAHGGLVDERAGLAGALRDISWWLANGVYPIFFVWETGLLEILEQAWRRRAAIAPRAFLTDPLVEIALGPTVGRPAWNKIKASARMASAPAVEGSGPGGATLLAARLAAWSHGFRTRTGAAAEWHAVGHSAGAIFHCHFLPVLQQDLLAGASRPAAGPALKTVSLLAPAVRTDLFKRTLAPRIGRGIGSLALFTMKQRDELRDNVLMIYRKSLLYFVRNACEEPPYSTAILGLEESVRADPELLALFGLAGAPGTAQAIWSPTSEHAGRDASQARSHSAFDEDRQTMDAVMRRILGLDDAAALPAPHPGRPQPR